MRVLLILIIILTLLVNTYAVFLIIKIVNTKNMLEIEAETVIKNSQELRKIREDLKQDGL